MQVSLNITGLTEFRGDLRRLQQVLASENIIGRVAAVGRNIITERTLAGKDVDLRPFQPYSRKPYYRSTSERPKAKGGRRRHKRSGKPLATVVYDEGYAQFAANTKASGNPNLFATGSMHRAFQSRSITSRRAVISFLRKQEALKALGNARIRRMVGFHPRREVPRLAALFNRQLAAAMRKAGL